MLIRRVRSVHRGGALRLWFGRWVRLGARIFLTLTSLREPRAAHRQPPFRRRLIFDSLESRLLLSADFHVAELPEVTDPSPAAIVEELSRQDGSDSPVGSTPPSQLVFFDRDGTRVTLTLHGAGAAALKADGDRIDLVLS